VIYPQYTKLHAFSRIDAFPFEIDQISATMSDRATLQEKTNLIYSSIKQHAETFPIVGSILNVTTLMEFKLSEMESMLCKMETRLPRSRSSRTSIYDEAKDCLGDSKVGDFRVDVINDMQMDCIRFEGTNASATLHNKTCSKVTSPSISSQLSWTLIEAGSTMKEAGVILRSVLEYLEMICVSSAGNLGVDHNALDKNSDRSDLVILEKPHVNDLKHVFDESASEMQEGNFDVSEKLEVEKTRLESAFANQVVPQVQQDTLLMQKLDHNEKLVTACTAALKVASNLEEIIHGFKSCSFDHDDDDAERMQIQVNELREQQQILTEQLCTLQFEHIECQEKLQRTTAEKLGLEEQMKKNQARFDLFQMNASLDFEKVTFAFEHQISEVEVQQYLQIERIHEKLQQDKEELESTTKRLLEQGKKIDDLLAKSQHDDSLLEEMKKESDQLQKSTTAAAEQNELQSISLQTAIADASAGEQKLKILESKLHMCESNSCQAVQRVSKDCKKLQLQSENILAIVLLCVSAILHCITQGWNLD
jgi:hypothetical protein